MGVVNTAPAVSMNATFAPVAPRRGRVGFSSQSGALGHRALGEAAELGLGISTFVSVGNKADVSGNDLLQYWEDDPETDVDPALPRVVREPAQVRPDRPAGLAAQADRRGKSGRQPAGARAASSHTGRAGQRPTSPSTRCSARPA